jgi:hypothetical protein
MAIDSMKFLDLKARMRVDMTEKGYYQQMIKASEIYDFIRSLGKK